MRGVNLWVFSRLIRPLFPFIMDCLDHGCAGEVSVACFIVIGNPISFHSAIDVDAGGIHGLWSNGVRHFAKECASCEVIARVF